jgi:hypothetical protein
MINGREFFTILSPRGFISGNGKRNHHQDPGSAGARPVTEKLRSEGFELFDEYTRQKL